MIVTEPEAGSRQCPEAFEPGNTFATGYCRVSDCMAWRWVVSETLGGNKHNSTKGYCGLAGKPEGTNQE